MRKSNFVLLLTAATIVGLAPLTGNAAPATPLDQFIKAVGKRTATEKANSAYCACAGGASTETGLIVAVPDADGGEAFVSVTCLVTLFDTESGEIIDVAACDENWTPLPK